MLKTKVALSSELSSFKDEIIPNIPFIIKGTHETAIELEIKLCLS